MSKTDQKIEELMAKHPSLSKEEATKIVSEKKARKKQKRTEKTNRATAKRAAYEANAPKAKASGSADGDGEIE